MVIHNIDPIFDENSEILILGSFPSVKSRDVGFFYGHKQNRFWAVTASVFGCELPQTIEEKKAFLLKNHIALWDVIASCDINLSSDSSIKNAVANDIRLILSSANIKAIFVNGKAAEKYYNMYILPEIGIKAVCLPSTSPANAAQSVESLCKRWSEEINRVIK